MKLCKLLLIVIILASSVSAGSIFGDLEDMMYGARNQLKLYSTEALEDSVIFDMCQRALLTTSVEIGGVPGFARILLDTNQIWYGLPDSTVDILAATLFSINGKMTKDLKRFHPEYTEERFKISKLEPSEDADVTPRAYDFFNDTVQIIPAPIKQDSVVFKIWLEHDVASASDSTIKLMPAFHEPALMKLCELIKRAVGLDAEAATYKALYDGMKAELRAKYGLYYRGVEKGE